MALQGKQGLMIFRPLAGRRMVGPGRWGPCRWSVLSLRHLLGNSSRMAMGLRVEKETRGGERQDYFNSPLDC